ncbi:MAG: hypothetical protein IH964_10775, partial [Candidatus Dadabacteria bacterium]|nr:hypothetical protein [Candidatus Dadabacteria bacterium]
MPKILNLNTFLLILLIATSYISTGVVGCNSGSGGNNKTTIRGVIEQVIGGTGEVSGIRVSIFENNRRRTSDRTNQSGVFRLTYKPDNDLATIEFEGSDFTLSR